MKIGDLVRFTGNYVLKEAHRRTGIVVRVYTTGSGSKEYSVRWLPSLRGRSRVTAGLLEVMSMKEGENII